MDKPDQHPAQPPSGPPSAQPFRFTPGWPGAPGYGAGYGPPPGGPYQQGGWGPQRPAAGPGQVPGPRGRGGRVLRWTGGIVAVALLAAGGTLAGLKLTGGPAPANGTNATAQNGLLGSSNVASAAGLCRRAAVSAPAGHAARAALCRRALLLRLARGMYGEVAVRGASGTVTLAFERGTVQSAGGGHLVVRAASGTTWTWDLASGSVVRSGGKTVPSSALTSGARVFVAGQMSGSARDARLVLVRTGSGGGSGSHASASRSAARSSAA